ncbi:MAG: hypothetical protein ACYDB3_06755 [Acidimicrobiales bacterium]
MDPGTLFAPERPDREKQPVGPAERMLIDVAVTAPIWLADPWAVTHWPTDSAVLEV